VRQIDDEMRFDSCFLLGGLALGSCDVLSRVMMLRLVFLARRGRHAGFGLGLRW
jgi:hypothetical protein